MLGKPRISIVGPGSLGSALAALLHSAGFEICELIARDSAASKRKIRELSHNVGACLGSIHHASLTADLIWLCVPDRQIQPCARLLAPKTAWKGKVVFHSSGALASDELAVLRKRGAAVASLHPFMTFVPRSVPSLSGVPFAVEGDALAVRTARRIVRKLGGEVFSIGKRHKAAYHAWGALASPLLIAELVSAELVAQAAGLSRAKARTMMLPIVRQTLANYAKLGPAASFSGPIVRGDAATLAKHLRVLRETGASEVYLALARLAVRKLPTNNRKILEIVLCQD